MLYRLLLAAAMICVPHIALPQADAQGQAPEPASMRFEWVREGPPEVCATNCREWVAATGPITSDTLKDFQFFGEVRDLRGATLMLDSGGGSVVASLELGRKVRQLNMKTTVGRAIKTPNATGGDRVKMSPRGECASMCVFVLLGGVHRTVPAEARVLVHQIWPGAKRYDASAESYTAEEMVRIQRDLGRIARYTVEMGGDIELFELAMRIPPWERLRSLSQSELRRMRLQSIETASEAPTSGVANVESSPKAARTHAPERGWMLAEGAPHLSLLRRHALTVEGEEIGQFELSLACGESGAFRIAYVDSRALSPDEASARLKDVTLWLGGERIALNVETSALRKETAELQSVATGVVTAAFVERFRTDPNSVLVVGTKTSDNMRTSIRVGGAGFAKVFPRLAAGCGKQKSAAISE
jgi:hypothetical protein